MTASQPQTEVLIQPSKRWVGLDLAELWRYRDLLIILMMRDVKLRYKQTALGIVWVVLQPLIAAIIFAVIFGLFAQLPSGDVPYLLMVFSGLLPWNVFAGALQRAGNSLISDTRLISKVYFPRIAIPLASSFSVLVDFAVALIVMFFLLLIEGWPLTPNLLVLPLLIVCALLVSIGVSLFFSALNVYYRDFMYALPFIIQVWMYASPIVYTIDIVPETLKPIYALNPMVGVIESFRWALLGTESFPLLSLTISVLLGAVLFIAGTFVFQRVEQSFADVI